MTPDQQRAEAAEADAKEWRERFQQCSTERQELEAQLQRAQTAGNALYCAIVGKLQAYFNADSRDLEWDVLPSTVSSMAQRKRELEAQLNTERARNHVQLNSALNERDMAQAQVAAMRAVFQQVESWRANGKQPREWPQDAFALWVQVRDMTATTAAQHDARVKAEALREAADKCLRLELNGVVWSEADRLRDRAAAIEKGAGL
jgi:hypothetical protein